MMTDPIADMLTRVRNANTAKHDEVRMPSSKQKVALAKELAELRAGIEAQLRAGEGDPDYWSAVLSRLRVAAAAGPSPGEKEEGEEDGPPPPSLSLPSLRVPSVLNSPPLPPPLDGYG